MGARGGMDTLDQYASSGAATLAPWAVCSLALAWPTGPARADGVARRRLRRALRGSVRRE
jgi:hypothetical protein